MLFLSDINDNAPRSPSPFSIRGGRGVCAETLLLQTEGADLEPYADPFTFELDNSWERAGDTWKLGGNWGEYLYWLGIKH